MSQRLALIIGNSQYSDDKLSKLKSPDTDVMVLKNVLENKKLGGFDDVKFILNGSSIQVRREIYDFLSKKTQDDLLLLYFSGHGVLDENGKLFLAVGDTDTQALRPTSIPARYITDEMDNSRSRRQVLILDCCHSGAFSRGTKSSTGASVGTKTTFEGIGFGRVVLTASDETQYAWEGSEIIGDTKNSLFTHFMVQGIQTGDADINQDGKITLDELYNYVYARVLETTPNQTPGKWSFREQGEIIISQSPLGIEQEHITSIEPNTFAGRDLIKIDDEIVSIPVVGQYATKKYNITIEEKEEVDTDNAGYRKAASGIHTPITEDNPAGIEWMEIPAGEFRYGIKKKRKIISSPFIIGKYPVTNAQFKLFIDANPYYKIPVNWNNKSRIYPKDEANHPVRYITWADTIAFCDWANCRLPTQEEWEKAARGEDGLIYPWGNKWMDGKFVNLGDSTTPVDKYPESVSPYGVWDMLGNIEEWTSSVIEEEIGYGDDLINFRILRGWNYLDLFLEEYDDDFWEDGAIDIASSRRCLFNPDDAWSVLRDTNIFKSKIELFARIGFRCARDIS
jgi:hypothetical protein